MMAWGGRLCNEKNQQKVTLLNQRGITIGEPSPVNIQKNWANLAKYLDHISKTEKI